MRLLCSQHVGLDEVILQMYRQNLWRPLFGGHLAFEHPERIWNYPAS